MKIKNIERFCFVALLLMPFVFALCSSLWVLGDKQGTVADFKDVFITNLKVQLPDSDESSYMGSALYTLSDYIVGDTGSFNDYLIWYLAYGLNLFILWMCVDCFIALPLVLKRFIDRGVYRE